GYPRPPGPARGGAGVYVPRRRPLFPRTRRLRCTMLTAVFASTRHLSLLWWEIPHMFERISNSFALARSSWHVLRTDKKLILFPIVSAIGVLLVLASFAIPLAVLAVQGQIQLQNNRPPVWVYPVAFAFYFCNYFVIVFCN